MRRWLIVASLAALLLPLPAVAANNTYPATTQPTYSICFLTTTAATTCSLFSGPPQTIIGIFNNSLSAQTGTVTCYDNPNNASGAVALNIGTLGTTQVIIFPAPGRPILNGLTCVVTATPVGGAIEVFIR